MFRLQKEDFDKKFNNILNSVKQTKKCLHQHILMIIYFFFLLNRKFHLEFNTYFQEIQKKM